MAPCLALVMAAGGASCVDSGAGPTGAGVQRRAIINGSLDTTTEAVVQVQGPSYECSGTIIARGELSAYVLTAASCVSGGAPVTVVQGDDVAAADAIRYPVVDFAVHPSFAGGGAPYDFAMVRVVGAGAATPVISPAAAPDGLSVGASIRNVGYGLTSYPNGTTTQRHGTTNVVGTLTSVEMSFDEATTGPCTGDQGGPSLSISSPVVVVGVIAYGSAGCAGTAVSGRVAAVHDAFITPYVTGAPALTCTQCATGATSALGGCVTEAIACAADSECAALRTCSDLCGRDDVACRDTCATQHPDGVGLYRAQVLCVCRGTCTTECTDDPWCSPRPGDPCSGAGECGSLFCADSVCCDAPCTGNCESCDLGPTTRGTCTAAAVGTDPRGRCVAASGGDPACAGACTAGGACAFPGAETSCGSCATCDGAGRCGGAVCADGGASQDAALEDAAATDAVAEDAVAPDAAGHDAVVEDAGAMDAAAGEAAAQDAAATDAAGRDAGIPADTHAAGDAEEPPDSGGGCGCRLARGDPAPTRTTWPVLVAVLFGAALRRPRRASRTNGSARRPRR